MLGIYVYGVSWKDSTWLSDPSEALQSVNNAFDSIEGLSFSGIIISSLLSSAGTSINFCIDNPVYKKDISILPFSVIFIMSFSTSV